MAKSEVTGVFLEMEIASHSQALVDNPEAELARILADARQKIINLPHGSKSFPIRDENGNRCGQCQVIIERDNDS